MGAYERLPEVWAAIDDVEPLRATPLVAAVLMNRTVTNANSTPMFRELMTDEGHTVLSTTIPRREPIAQAFGGPVTELGKYADAADEIETLGAGRGPKRKSCEHELPARRREPRRRRPSRTSPEHPPPRRRQHPGRTSFGPSPYASPPTCRPRSTEASSTTPQA